MLAIYGTSGLMYRGPIEDLRRVLPSLRSARLRPLATEVDRPDFADSGFRVPARRDGDGDHGGGAALPRTAAVAVQTYGEVQRPTVPRQPLQRVQDVMSRTVVTVRSDLSVGQGWRALAECGVGQAPVLDADGRLVGLLTRAELLSLDHLPRPEDNALVWRAFLAQPLSQVMITPVPGVTADTLLRRLALALLATGLPGLPVVDEAAALIGFVSRSDILKAVVHDPPLDLWAG
ncbi:CBS domain-containing protein [Tepidimonas charontis]|uniref:ProV: glycine betaine/L-proline transport ATP binding subunit n=1 Tax=Tepidimonas charontis TaxID=2267262 RepID=A0A554XFI1_9BURK|nr:CBS domain-containing protein [Tepidimonas charontis]TSE34539.1 proV: glycine betaine/L-proline transport ATP binding subunit [Tepidimonas charontis]